MKHKSTPNFREFCREKIGSETTLKNAHFCNPLKLSLLLPKLHFEEEPAVDLISMFLSHKSIEDSILKHKTYNI